jgi:hypothetical protein
MKRFLLKSAEIAIASLMVGMFFALADSAMAMIESSSTRR